MQVVMENVFPQNFRHGTVSFICVHYCGENILLAAYDFHSGFVGISVELLSKFIAAVSVKVSGVHIEDQLAVGLGIVLQTTGGSAFNCSNISV